MKRIAIAILLCLGVPSLAQAAERVLLDRIGPNQATLYVAQGDGANEHALLPAGALDYDPAWSPKGDWIAFTSEREGSADLFRVHPDGSGLERLTDSPAYDDQAAFSPNGKQLVFVSTRADGFANLWILDAASHDARQLTKTKAGNFRPAWSPDGKWIAFSSDRDSDLPGAKGRWERMHIVSIYLVHPDGSGLKRLTPKDGNFCGSPKWTADGKSLIAYCMTGQATWDDRVGKIDVDDEIRKIDVATGTMTVVPAGPGVKEAPFPLASGDIGYLRRDKSKEGLHYASGKTGPAGADIRSPAWSPDGSRVVYSRFATVPQPTPAHLWSRNAKFDLYNTTMLASVDAVHDRYATTQRAGGNTKLVVIDNGKARTILERPDLILAPQWSADGKQIVAGVGTFASFLDFEVGGRKPVDPANGGAQVALLNQDGSGFRLLTSGPNNNGFPTFSPDGKRIIYRTAGPEGQGLRILNPADGSVTKLTNEWDNFPLWSPRGDLIAFVRRNGAGDFQIFTIHPDGTGLKQLSHTHGNDAHLAWSPDGSHVLFTSSRLGFKDEALYTGAPQPYGEIFVMRADGSEIEQLTDDQWEEGGPAWLPKSKD